MARGFAESTARWGISFSNTRNRGLLLTCEWTTNVASTGRNTASSRPSRKDSWLPTMSVRSFTNTRPSPVMEIRNSGRNSVRNTNFTSRRASNRCARGGALTRASGGPPGPRWKGVRIAFLPDLCCCTRTATIGNSASSQTQLNAPPPPPPPPPAGPARPSLPRFTIFTLAFPARTSASNRVKAASKWSIICVVAAVNPSTPASRETRSS